MGKHYSAFGLSLLSPFSLPGLTPAEVDDALPRLELVLQTAAQLSSAWSGSDSSTPWQGRLKDGSSLTIEWGNGGDLLFGYGDRARFRLDPSATRLACAPAGAAALSWQRALLSRVLPVVAVVHGYEALHAAAVDTEAGVVAIAAPSGAGKSTLVRELLGRGHRLFTDDVLVIGSRSGEVRAHPGTPHMSVLGGDAPDIPLGPLGNSLGTFGGKRWITVDRASSSPSRVAAVAILERGGDLSLEAQELPPSPLTLAPFMLGALEGRDRNGDRFSVYSDLVEAATLVRLTGGADHRARDLADSLEDLLGSRVSPVAKGAA